MATEQEELAQDMTTAVEQLAKIKEESTATKDKVTALETAMSQANGKLTPAVKAAWAALKGQIQVVDDVITDTPTETTPQNPGTVNPA